MYFFMSPAGGTPATEKNAATYRNSLLTLQNGAIDSSFFILSGHIRRL